LIIVEGNRPAAELVEAFHCINQMPEEGVPAHLSIGNHVQAGFDLHVDGFIDGAVFDFLEFGVGQFTGSASLPGFF
jgi:hypothetical protein